MQRNLKPEPIATPRKASSSSQVEITSTECFHLLADISAWLRVPDRKPAATDKKVRGAVANSEKSLPDLAAKVVHAPHSLPASKIALYEY